MKQLLFILQYLCLTRKNSIFMEHLQNYIFKKKDKKINRVRGRCVEGRSSGCPGARSSWSSLGEWRQRAQAAASGGSGSWLPCGDTQEKFRLPTACRARPAGAGGPCGAGASSARSWTWPRVTFQSRPHPAQAGTAPNSGRAWGLGSGLLAGGSGQKPLVGAPVVSMA